MLMFKTSSPGALLKHAAFRKVRICWWLVLQDQRLESQKTNEIERGGVDYVYIYIPIPSMYAIFPYIWLVYMVNVGQYTITWMVWDISYLHIFTDTTCIYCICI